MQLLERIDEARERWNVLRHPFYVRWERGELSRGELAFYAGEYRHAVVALAGAAAASGDAAHAREEREHVDLWDDVAAALDAPPRRDPLPQTRECAEAWSPGDELEALAVLSAVEASQPAISETKLRGLLEHYGFEPGTRGTRYFELHAERDVEHAREARAALIERAAAGDEDRLAGAAERALAANWRLLDGVEGAFV